MGLLNIYSSSVHLEREYEKPEDASLAATLVQHSMPPSAAANAPGDADSTATLSAAQHATQCSSLCIKTAQTSTGPTQTRNSRSRTNEVQIKDSSRSPYCVSELKKLKSCNYSSKRQCGLLGLLDVCTETACSFVS